MFPITEHVAKHDGHASFYLACGAADAPPIIFVHGWPDLSIGWRHQLPVAVNRARARFMAAKLPDLLSQLPGAGRGAGAAP